MFLKKLILKDYTKIKNTREMKKLENISIKKQLISFLEDIEFIFSKDSFKEIIELSFTKE